MVTTQMGFGRTFPVSVKREEKGGDVLLQSFQRDDVATVGSAERQGGMRWKRCGETENRPSGWRHFIVSLKRECSLPASPE